MAILWETDMCIEDQISNIKNNPGAMEFINPEGYSPIQSGIAIQMQMEEAAMYPKIIADPNVPEGQIICVDTRLLPWMISPPEPSPGLCVTSKEVYGSENTKIRKFEAQLPEQLTKDPDHFTGHLKNCPQDVRVDYKWCSCNQKGFGIELTTDFDEDGDDYQEEEVIILKIESIDYSTYHDCDYD